MQAGPLPRGRGVQRLAAVAPGPRIHPGIDAVADCKVLRPAHQKAGLRSLVERPEFVHHRRGISRLEFERSARYYLAGEDSRFALTFWLLQPLARRRLPVLLLLVALGVAVERALEIAERDHEARPAVLEAALGDVVLEERPAAPWPSAFHIVTRLPASFAAPDSRPRRRDASPTYRCRRRGLRP